MLNIGDKIAELRKRKNWSQADLAKAVEASRDIIGKYERNENLPSLEMALRIAKAFDVSVDFLIGQGVHAAYDKETMKRMEQVQKLSEKDKEHVYALLDAFLLKCSIEKNMAK